MAYGPGPPFPPFGAIPGLLAPIRVYVLNFVVSEKLVLDMIDLRMEVLNWYRYFPGMVLIASRHDPAALHGVFHTALPEMAFLLVEVDRTKAVGLINQEVWDFINNPKPSGRWGLL